MEKLFRQIETILQRLQAEQEAGRKRGEQFNMFAACGVNHYEVTHSSIIAELLNPHGSHGQGTLFLEAFLTSFPSDFKFYLDGEVNVKTEFAISEGRIDILITNSRGQAIIIENKIYAQDQYEQLKRYDLYAKKHYGEGNYEILYLTLHGSEASEESVGTEGVSYKTISYASTILEWLEDCIKLSTRWPIIRETIIQYQNHIQQLTGKDMTSQERKQIFQSMAAHPQETATIVNAALNGYTQYVYETYVRGALKDYAVKHELTFHEHDEASINDGFYFQHPTWKKTCIKVAGGSAHYIGISCSMEGSEEDLATLTQQQMECFDDKPNGWWPYGTSYLDSFSDWSAAGDTIPAMIDGRFVAYIKQTVGNILNELKEKNIEMI